MKYRIKVTRPEQFYTIFEIDVESRKEALKIAREKLINDAGILEWNLDSIGRETIESIQELE